MKCAILVIATILMLAVAVQAQSTPGVAGYGLKLGFDIAKISTDYEDLDEFLDSRSGFIGGAYLTYKFNRQFAVRPEILYVAKGAEKDLFFVTPYWSINYLEFPVLLVFDVVPDGRVRPNLFVGPAMSVLLSSEVGVSGESMDVAEGMKTMDFGLVFGAGVDFKRITFDVRYTLGLMNTIDAAKINDLTGSEAGDYFYLEGDPEVKNTNLSFMIGVRF
jgi:opacity protein-like surface antigen